VIRSGGLLALGSGSLVALALMLAPAFAAQTQPPAKKKARSAPRLSIGSFTPATADPRLAAELARRGLQPSSFRFTPSAAATPGKSKAVRVAVRARSVGPSAAAQAGREPSSTPVTAITPTAYNLGLSVGWKRFALSGDVARIEGGLIPGGKDAAEVGISFQGKRFTGRLSAGAERNDGIISRLAGPEASYSVDVGGSYSIARNIDVTGGVRYKIDRDSDGLEALADQRRDSQAVYVGTAFRF
jgi:hypothetical protein